MRSNTVGVPLNDDTVNVSDVAVEMAGSTRKTAVTIPEEDPTAATGEPPTLVIPGEYDKPSPPMVDAPLYAQDTRYSPAKFGGNVMTLPLIVAPSMEDCKVGLAPSGAAAPTPLLFTTCSDFVDSVVIPLNLGFLSSIS